MKNVFDIALRCVIIWPLMFAMDNIWPTTTVLAMFCHWLLFVIWFIVAEHYFLYKAKN